MFVVVKLSFRKTRNGRVARPWAAQDLHFSNSLAPLFRWLFPTRIFCSAALKSGRWKRHHRDDSAQCRFEQCRLDDIHRIRTFLLFGVFHVGLLDLAVELKRRLVVILETNRRAEVDTEVQALVGGKPQRRADGHHARGNFLAIDL